VVKLVDAGDSKSPAARRAGSIPALGTIKFPSNTQATQRKPAPAERFAGFSFLVSQSCRAVCARPIRFEKRTERATTNASSATATRRAI
jgi:hypothetical protein